MVSCISEESWENVWKGHHRQAKVAWTGFEESGKSDPVYSKTELARNLKEFAGVSVTNSRLWLYWSLEKDRKK